MDLLWLGYASAFALALPCLAFEPQASSLGRRRRRATAHPDRLIDLDRALSGVPPFSWMSGVVEGLFIKN